MNTTQVVPTATADQTIEQEIRKQAQADLTGTESEDEKQMVYQKYGLAPIKFNRIEEQVIKKQKRKEAKILEAEFAGA